MRDFDAWMKGEFDCTVCQDSGWVSARTRKMKRVRPDGQVEEYEVSSGVRRCECRTKHLGKQLLNKAGLPAMHGTATFDNYEPLTKQQQMARLMAMKYVEEWPSTNEKGLLFTGTSGVGKTHLLVAMAKQLIENRLISCAFVDFNMFLDRRKDEFARKTADEETARVLSAELLFLDDIGVSRITDFAAEVLSKIINERYNRRLPIVATTNLPFTASENARLLDTGGLGDRIGARAFSRLSEMCRVLTIDGEDFRQNVKRANFV
jgi:DNA replication protein DnaC